MTSLRSPDLQDGAAELERQVERASLFTHTAVGRNAARLAEVESFLYGLIDLLVENGTVSPETLAEAAQKVREESLARGDVPHSGVAIDLAPREPSVPPVQVNCLERLHICEAACCKLDFALTVDEVEGGRIKWDLGRPYLIRHAADGFCVHRDRTSGRCGVYEERPVTCKGYSCATDTRIWKNFEKMELNTEWLSSNLGGTERPRARAALVHLPVISPSSDEG
ncbi:MAG TPA: YkgJ family cysteine cluster protein [Polyangia bacterium]|nr:YkgJ family cysteine cluster protein [Polyangia bacterium]